jgi:hypothetical protein
VGLGVIFAANKKGSKCCLLSSSRPEVPLGAALAVFLAEFVDSAGSVNNLLGAGIERVALRTYFNVEHGFCNHGLGLEAVATAASNGEFFVIRVNICFHFLSFGLLVRRVYALTGARIIHKIYRARKFCLRVIGLPAG